MRVLVFMFIAIFSGSVSLAVVDDFKGRPDQQFKIWPAIPFIFAGDLSDFADAHSNTRKDIRRELIADLERLIKAGSYASEAAPIILEFDKIYDRYRQISRQGVEIALEEMFRNGIDQSYRQYEVSTRKLNFINGGEVASIKSNNGRSGTSASVDLMAYGTYTVINKQAVQVQINFFRLQDLQMRSFAVQGPINKLNEIAHTLALNVFDFFQRLEGPTEIRKGLLLLGTPKPHEGKAVPFAVAEHACESMGGSLPTYEEFLDVELAGPYNGGTWLQEANYVLKPKDGDYQVYDREEQKLWRSSWINEKTALYICIRN